MYSSTTIECKYQAHANATKHEMMTTDADANANKLVGVLSTTESAASCFLTHCVTGYSSKFSLFHLTMTPTRSLLQQEIESSEWFASQMFREAQR